jgi:glycosyltransferase involved in cell wall biosynthesis
MNHKTKIAWLVPPPLHGSGGLRVIFNLIQHLCDRGCDCHAFVDGGGKIETVLELADQVQAFYGATDCALHLGWDLGGKKFDLAIATIWTSAREVAKAPASVKKVYLVQDYEAWFNPMGAGFVEAEDSYRLGLHPICIGRWLPNALREKFGAFAHYFDFGCDHQIYQPVTPLAEREPAICMIHQPDKPRRCSEIGLGALEVLKREMPEVTVYLYGSPEQAKVDFPHVNLGVLHPREINGLYNRCRAGLCISSSNPSRIPFEMMAAGLPVVDIYRENNLYDFPDEGVLLADPNPVAINRALKSLLQEPARLQRMSEFGSRWMESHPIEKEYGQFYTGVAAVLRGEDTAPELPGRCYRRGAVKAF